MLWGLILSLLPAAVAAEPPKPYLHELFTDHAVLQRNAMIPVWGWTDPGKTVSVSLNGKTAQGTADADGRWMAKVGPFEAGGPFTMTVSGPKTVELKDLLIGDVWLCSGQSNMQWGLDGATNADAEIAAADHPQVRLFDVPRRVAFEPMATVDAKWEVCSPKTARSFSAVAYFFGRDLEKELKVPIGLVHSSWGGTVAEAWTSAEGLATLKDFRADADVFRDQAAKMRSGIDDFPARLAEWWRKNDPGVSAQPPWQDPAADVSAWKTMSLPGAWESNGLPGFDGIVWFRREFDLPESAAGKPFTLELGTIDDQDTTYVNGREVGQGEIWFAPRSYKVPVGVARAGRNVVAVRVLDTGGNGGFTGKPEDMKIQIEGLPSIALSGPWTYRDAASRETIANPPQRFAENPNLITVLYNGMIAPLAPFPIKGAIWYQGESNVGRAEQYTRLLPAMIADWRGRFGVGDFPFLIVQLANFQARVDQPQESAWAELRDAQTKISRADPKVGLASAIDIGEALDIHPKNKQDVGHRLALNALKIANGRDVENSGPLFRSMAIRDHAARIQFDHLGGGLEAKGGGKLTGFAIAGEDHKFVWADAKLDGDTVVVSSPKVENPVAVRYAWADNPECNLINKAGLPAVSFRTDGAK